MTTEREKCAEILARKLTAAILDESGAWSLARSIEAGNDAYVVRHASRALAEARDLARREALEEAAHKFTDNYADSVRFHMRSVAEIIRSLISQPSPETQSAGAGSDAWKRESATALFRKDGSIKIGPKKSAGAESVPEPSTDGRGAAEVASASVPAEPIPMRLVCPRCGTLHLDVGEFATKPHHTHACQQCGEVWRPAIVATVGVEFLPGFKNEPAPPDTEAWKRVPVDAGMLTNVLEQFADVHRPVEVLFTHLYGLAVKIERAARAKQGE